MKRVPASPLRDRQAGTMDTPSPCDTSDATLSQWRTSCRMTGMKPADTHMDSTVS
ncbi:hypothetical protein D3C85_1813530 [compost metagenome]